MNAFILAARPKTLIASISPVCLGTALAIGDKSFSVWLFGLTLLMGLSIQILTNLVNDLFDFLKGVDTHQRKGPTRVVASGLMSLNEIKIAILGTSIATLAIGISLAVHGGIIIASLIPLSLLLAFGYTAGPFPLSYLGIAEVFVFVFFGPVASGMTYYLQTLKFSAPAFIIGISPGLLSCSILILNNLRDVKEDTLAKKRTLVVRFGTTFGKWEYALSLMLGILLPFFTFGKHPLYLLSTMLLLPAFILTWAVAGNQDPKRYNQLFAQTGKLLILYTLIGFLGLIL